MAGVHCPEFSGGEVTGKAKQEREDGWVDGWSGEDKTAVMHALPAEGGAAVQCARQEREIERLVSNPHIVTNYVTSTPPLQLTVANTK